MKNNELLQIALLGTAKKTLNSNILPPVLQPAVANSPDAETSLLNALAATKAYEQGVWNGDALSIPHLPIAPAEVHNYAPAKVSRLLWDILHSDKPQIPLEIVELLLQKWVKHQWLLPINWLDELSGWHNQLPPHLLLPIAGERGRWLWQIKADKDDEPLGKYLAKNIQTDSSIDETVWQEGSYAERKNALEQCRIQTPDTARAWLSSTWNKENANDKVNFLKILENGLSEQDIPFLNDVLRGINTFEEAKLKPKQRELRQVVASFLARIPQSESHEAVVQAVLHCFQMTEKRQLAIIKKVIFEYKTPDSMGFWEPINLQKQYGIEIPSNLPDGYKVQDYCLVQLMQYVPLSRWESLTNWSAEAVCNHFLLDKKMPIAVQFRDELFVALQTAAYNYANSVFAYHFIDMALSKKSLLEQLQPQLYKVLSIEDKKRLLLHHSWVDVPQMYDLLLSLPREMLHDTAFALHLLAQSEKYVQRVYTNPAPRVMALFSQIIPLSVLEKFKKDIEKRQNNEAEKNYYLPQLQTHIATPLLQLHNIIQQIKSI